MLNSIKMEHRRLLKKGADDSPLARLYPAVANREIIGEGGSEVDLDTYTGAAETYQSYVWVRKCISVKANAIAPLPVRVIDEKSGEEVKGHILNGLLDRINDNANPAQFWNEFTVDMDLSGEFLAEVVEDGRGRPAELWSRRPDKIKVKPDRDRGRDFARPVAYVYNDDDDNPIPPERMVHVKYHNPLNPWRGLGTITAIRHAIILDVYVQAWSRLFMKQGGRPDWAVIAPEGITPTEKQELEDLIAAKFSGWKNAHRPIILEQGVTDIKTFSHPPVDMQWLEQRKIVREEVGAILGVPDEIAGWGRDTYENFDTAYRVLWLLTLVPLLTFRDVALTTFFSEIRRELKPNQVIATDLSGVGVIQEDLMPKLEQAQILFTMGYPPNAINQRLRLGMPDVPWGDVGYMQDDLIEAGTGNEMREVVGGQMARLVDEIKQAQAANRSLIAHQLLLQERTNGDGKL